MLLDLFFWVRERRTFVNVGHSRSGYYFTSWELGLPRKSDVRNLRSPNFRNIVNGNHEIRFLAPSTRQQSMTKTWQLPSHTPNLIFHNPSKAIFYYYSHCHIVQLQIDDSHLRATPTLLSACHPPIISTHDMSAIAITYYATISVACAFYLCLWPLSFFNNNHRI